MAGIVYWVLLLTFLTSLFFGPIFGAKDDCERGKNGIPRIPDFNRVFTYTYDGPSGQPADRDDFQKVLGSCGDPNSFSDKMLEFYSSLGFDTSDQSLRSSPFTDNSLPQFNITTSINVHPSGRVVTGTFYEYGEFMGERVYDGNSLLTSNVDVSSKDGTTIPAGSSFAFGHIRFRVSGQDKCIFYKTLHPIVGGLNQKAYYAAVDFELEHKEWGKGSALGVLVLHADSGFTRTEARMVITFPPVRRPKGREKE